MFANQADRPFTPARAAEGRFHSAGQLAVYTSLSPEGAGIAIAGYVRPADQARVIIPLRVRFNRVADHRGNPAASVIWQELRARGLRSPTWQFSEAARNAGAQAMLYSSRSRPELSHMVIFTTLRAGENSHAGPARPWSPTRQDS